MAIVRELTTLLDFKVEGLSGLSRAETAVNQVKSSIVALGKLFGIVFGLEKLYEFVDELTNVGKEINKLTYQLNRMAREGDNVPAALKDLFDIAQNVGVEYTNVLDVYKEMLNESRELNVSQDQLLNTVDNIYKGLRLGAASGEEISQTFESLNRSFRMGRIGRRQFGLLNDIAPEVIKALGASLGKTSEQLEQMAKDGKITAEVLINGLGKSITTLNEEYAKRPRKLGEAFTYVWNKAGELSARIYKLVSLNSMVASGIIRLTDMVSNFLVRLSSTLGGLKRTLELIGIATVVAFGPAFLRSIQLAVVWTTRLIARNLALIATYAAWAIALAAVVIAIQDFMVWMQGGDSVIGDWLGPFDKFQEDFKKLFDSANFFAPFKAFQNLIEGDFAGAWEKVKQSIRDVDGLLGTLAISIAAVVVGFRAWNVLKFTGLVAALRSVAVAAGAVSIAAGTALTDLMKIARARLLIAGGVLGAAILAGMYGKEMLESGMDAALGRDPEKAQADRSAIQSAGSSQFWSMINPRNWFPSITPGQMTPAAPGSPGGSGGNTNTVNQNNNVVIKVEPGSNASVVDEIKAGVSSLFDAWGRQARNAVPLTETPKQ